MDALVRWWERLEVVTELWMAGGVLVSGCGRRGIGSRADGATGFHAQLYPRGFPV